MVDCVCLRPLRRQLERLVGVLFDLDAASHGLFEYSGKRSQREPKVWGNAHQTWGNDLKSRSE